MIGTSEYPLLIDSYPSTPRSEKTPPSEHSMQMKNSVEKEPNTLEESSESHLSSVKS